MEAIMLGVIIVLLCTSLYFAYGYASLKRQLSLTNKGIDAMKDASTNHVNEQFQLFTTNIADNAKNLTEHGEYAAEKADIVRAAIDEVGKGLKKQLIATEKSAISIEDINEAIKELSIKSNQISEQSNTTLKLTQDGNEKLKDSMVKMEQLIKRLM